MNRIHFNDLDDRDVLVFLSWLSPKVLDYSKSLCVIIKWKKIL